MRFSFLFPLFVFAGLLALFFTGLGHDPSIVPSPLVNRLAPEFNLPSLEAGEEGLKTADLMGTLTLVNFFASWCLPCKVEHPLLVKLKKEGRIRVVGINYKDKPKEAKRWLAERGNPYDRIGADSSGRVAIDWGVYGVPESYLVDQNGRIRWKHVGVLTPGDWHEDFVPLIKGFEK